MKHLKILATGITVAAMSLFMVSCGSGDDEKKTEETSKDTTAKTTETPPPPTPVKPDNVAVVTHKVANYAKWKPVYDADDAARQAAGLKNYVIARGMGKDSNTVMIALKMSDTAKAKAFGSSKELMAKMKEGGVIGKPTVMLVNVVTTENEGNPTPARLRVTHKVKDFDAWKKVFDSHKQDRVANGFLDRSVGYSFDDNHLVSVVFIVTDMAKAKAFVASKDLKDKMAEAGVVGPPTMFWFNVVQRY